MAVAEIIARVFPAYRWFPEGDMKDFPEHRFSFVPYPKDTLQYKSNALVEYRTPAGTEGLGTYVWVKKGSLPIEGVAMLIGDVRELALLTVRLPVHLNGLATTIIRQFERDAARD